MAKADRRSAIVDAAARLVWERGLGAATVRAVAAALDASPGQIHHHFASADDLRAEAFRAAWRIMAADCLATLAELPPRRRLLGLLTPPDQPAANATRLWKDALAAARMSEAVRLAVRESLADWHTVIVAALAAGKAAGEFPDALDEAATASRLMAIALGLDVWIDIGFSGDAAAGRALVEDALAVELAAAR